ncbi:MAG: polysaccharide deacetylase family protein [Candidatus Omnitrophica bacterium]|nr:polysaccharide deacetylase family protein [Candidatus Omnitrophota bacterium]
MKKSVRTAAIVLGLLLLCLAGFLIKPQPYYCVPVLMYHEVDPRPIGESRLIVSPRSFDRQMGLLKRRRAQAVPFSEVVESFKTGKGLPKNAVALTFDDGFENFYTNAWPVLKKYDFPAIVFIITQEVGKPGFLTWDQIVELDRAGVTIGSHSIDHPWLPALREEDLRRELVESKRILEEKLGHAVDYFCYPMGAHDARVIEAVKSAGYLGASATHPGRLASNTNPYAVKRMRIWKNSDNLVVFWAQSSGYYTWWKEFRKKKKANKE